MPARSLPWMILAAALGCADRPPASPGPAGEAAPPSSKLDIQEGPADPEPEPEVEPSWDEPGGFELLPSELGEVLLWAPGGTGPRPLAVVAHGAGGSPEWHCDFWARVVQDAAFLLCLRGKPLDASGFAYFFPQHRDLDARIEAALAAFRERHAARWTGGQSVYIGYSQGATFGALVLPTRSDFAAALLAEGGYEQWPVKNAREFHVAGGKRVFFACGTGSCERGAKRSVGWLERGGVEATHAMAAGAGHTPAGAVGALSVRGLGWLVRGWADWSDLDAGAEEQRE